METLEKAELAVLVCHIEGFSKSGIPIFIPEIPTRLAEKQEEEEGNWQWQSGMRFTQTQ